MNFAGMNGEKEEDEVQEEVETMYTKGEKWKVKKIYLFKKIESFCTEMTNYLL